jgi:hypothetical protein
MYHVFDRCLIAVSCCRTECIRFPTVILLLYHVAGQNVTGIWQVSDFCIMFLEDCMCITYLQVSDCCIMLTELNVSGTWQISGYCSILHSWMYTAVIWPLYHVAGQNAPVIRTQIFSGSSAPSTIQTGEYNSLRTLNSRAETVRKLKETWRNSLFFSNCRFY